MGFLLDASPGRFGVKSQKAHLTLKPFYVLQRSLLNWKYATVPRWGKQPFTDDATTDAAIGTASDGSIKRCRTHEEISTITPDPGTYYSSGGNPTGTSSSHLGWNYTKYEGELSSYSEVLSGSGALVPSPGSLDLWSWTDGYEIVTNTDSDVNVVLSREYTRDGFPTYTFTREFIWSNGETLSDIVEQAFELYQAAPGLAAKVVDADYYMYNDSAEILKNIGLPNGGTHSNRRAGSYGLSIGLTSDDGASEPDAARFGGGPFYFTATTWHWDSKPVNLDGTLGASSTVAGEYQPKTDQLFPAVIKEPDGTWKDIIRVTDT